MRTERRIADHHEDPRVAHHLWAADEDEGGVHVRRNRQEPEMFPGEPKTAKTAATLSQKIAAEKCVACLGLFGADLVDDPTLNSDLPIGVVGRFNAAARDEAVPRIREWAELRRAFGEEKIAHARKAIGRGMQTRLTSKMWNLPFLMTSDIMDQFPSVPLERVAQAVEFIRSTPPDRRVGSTMDFIARRVAKIFEEYSDPSSRRLAVDEKASAYWQSYYGPFGKELVREVQKRVRADLAGIWLRKNGVDEVAAEYWRKYFGEYGDKWVTVVPKKLSPSNAKR